VEQQSFAVTWDYRCPFARNAHEHLVAALEAGAPWDVTFLPFSLNQAHVAEGQPAVWDNPDKAPDLAAMLSGIVVRDRFPDLFFGAHLALFTARHDRALDLRERAVLEGVLDEAGLPGSDVLREVDAGWALKELRSAHEQAVAEHAVFGVPTFILGDRAVFVRLMSRPEGDEDLARSTIGRVLQLIEDEPELNEFKYTKLGR
jgi:hypothetical protein